MYKCVLLETFKTIIFIDIVWIKQRKIIGNTLFIRISAVNKISLILTAFPEIYYDIYYHYNNIY